MSCNGSSCLDPVSRDPMVTPCLYFFFENVNRLLAAQHLTSASSAA